MVSPAATGHTHTCPLKPARSRRTRVHKAKGSRGQGGQGGQWHTNNSMAATGIEGRGGGRPAGGASYTFTAGRPPWYDRNGEVKHAFIIGVAGGSASGKTTVAE